MSSVEPHGRHLCTDSNTPRGALQEGGENFRHSLSSLNSIDAAGREGKRGESGREDGRDSFTSFFGALRKKVLQPHSPIKVQHQPCREVGNFELFCRVHLCDLESGLNLDTMNSVSKFCNVHAQLSIDTLLPCKDDAEPCS